MLANSAGQLHPDESCRCSTIPAATRTLHNASQQPRAPSSEKPRHPGPGTASPTPSRSRPAKIDPYLDRTVDQGDRLRNDPPRRLEQTVDQPIVMHSVRSSSRRAPESKNSGAQGEQLRGVSGLPGLDHSRNGVEYSSPQPGRRSHSQTATCVWDVGDCCTIRRQFRSRSLCDWCGHDGFELDRRRSGERQVRDTSRSTVTPRGRIASAISSKCCAEREYRSGP